MKELVYLKPDGSLEIWKRNHGFDFLGLERYEVDNTDGEFWVDGNPEVNGLELLGEI